MNVKKSIAVAISMVLITLISPLSLPADNSASAETEIWDGTYDTSWYDEEETELHISTAEELAGLAELVNAGQTMEGQMIYLDNDIYLNDVSDFENWESELPANNWNPIGMSATCCFEGVFDGQMHEIIGLYSMQSSLGLGEYYCYIGFFGYSGASSAIKNIVLTSGYLAFDSIRNFGYYGSNTPQEHHYLGGISGYNEGTITACHFNGLVECDVDYSLNTSTNYVLNQYTGGICGFNNQGVISECMVNGAIYTDGRGYVSSSGDYYCYLKEYVGGICGYSQNGHIYRCGNNTIIQSNTSCNGYGKIYSGGICGYGTGKSDTFTIEECYNVGTISAEDIKLNYGGSIQSGGICGYAVMPYTVNSCYNWGDISISADNTYAGGITGRTSTSHTTEAYGSYEAVYNTGVILADGYAAGVVGYVDELAQAPVTKDCYYLVDHSSQGIGNAAESTVGKTMADMQTESFAESLGEAFVYNEGGYPLLAWEAELQQAPLMGDVNLDGIFDVADIKLLQDYLVCRETLTVEQGVVADVCTDGILDVFDLCILKRMYLEQSETA